MPATKRWLERALDVRSAVFGGRVIATEDTEDTEITEGSFSMALTRT